MIQTKRRRRYTILDDSDDDTKIKLQCTNKNKSKTSIEDLSNELLYEIFEYLDAYFIYESFFKLNQRFQNLLLYSNFLFEIDIPSLSKSTFEHYYTQVITANKHHIKSLHLSDPFTVQYFFSLNDDISIYWKLQTLMLYSMESENLANLLERLVTLPKLSSLGISIADELYKNNIFDLIFQLPVLKSCQMSFPRNVNLESMASSTITSNSLEHLIIHGICNYTILDTILSHIPHLRRLSIQYLSRLYDQVQQLITPVSYNLTHISITLHHVSFDHIEQYIKMYFSHVKVLYISSNGSETYLDADRWQHLIVFYMQHLQIFDFQHTNKILYGDSIKWFFTHEPYSKEHLHGIFYSIQPYRREYFTLASESDSNEIETIYHSVRHVIVDDGEVINDCLKYFPNATELSLCNNCLTFFKWPRLDDLSSLIPLIQLTKITIDLSYRRFHRLIQLLILELTPNVHTLILNSITSNQNDIYSLLPKGRNFQLVSSKNKIKNIIFKTNYSIKVIQLFMNLCRQLQHITINLYSPAFKTIIGYLLSKRRKTICHLSSLSIVNVPTELIDKVKILIKSKKHLHNCSMTNINGTFYIWW
ncbi:hypothetical protein I4U23_022841 [Adineta vaga]|nr:hypothetical protein I4U23_022841 [Adineta vaga]